MRKLCHFIGGFWNNSCLIFAKIAPDMWRKIYVYRLIGNIIFIIIPLYLRCCCYKLFQLHNSWRVENSAFVLSICNNFYFNELLHKVLWRKYLSHTDIQQKGNRECFLYIVSDEINIYQNSHPPSRLKFIWCVCK